MYKPLFGFSTDIISYAPAEEAFVPVSETVRRELLSLLDTGDYTYVELSDGNAVELAKLQNYCGALILYRGVFGTKAKQFPCGAKLQYVITPHTVEKLTCYLDNCEDNTMPYAYTPAFSVNTTAVLADIDTDLPIADDKIAILLAAVPEGSHTYLRVTDGFNTEVLKVSNIYGKITTERGQELTSAHTFPTGSVIEHVMTPSAIRDIVCQMECCPQI